MATYRRRTQRSNRRSSWDLPTVGGILLAITAVSLVVAFFVFGPEPPSARDPDTLCPTSGPSKVTAIVVDTTDRIVPITRADIIKRLDEVVAASQTDERMLAYETTTVSNDVGIGGNPLPPVVDVCNPGDPEQVSEWTENPRLVRRRFEASFRRPLARVFSDLVNLGEPADRSPLMESVQAISVTVFARQEYADIPKRLMLISDLLQYSDNLSLYEGQPDYDTFAASIGADALRTDLGDVDVEVMFIQRRDHQRFDDSRRLVEFWERWVDEQQGRLTRVSKIDGMN